MIPNKDILNLLKQNRDVKAFAKYIGVSPQWLYKLLSSEAVAKNQTGNLYKFILAKYKGEV